MKYYLPFIILFFGKKKSFRKSGTITTSLIIGYFSTLSFLLFSQTFPISIDGQFNDWTPTTSEITDPANDGDDIELLRMTVANDDTHFFIQLEIAQEINLTDNHKLTLFLDTDLNISTGKYINGIGADLEIMLGERDVFYQLPSGQGYLSLNDLHFRHLPTVTSSLFEMAIDLEAVSNAGYDLFNANGVHIVWKDMAGPLGDAMPDNGNLFTYYFDETPAPPVEAISLEKSSNKSVRLATWNTLNNGLDDLDREEFFNKILGVLKPDIITFNECWDINAFQVASFMNAAVPLPNFQNWNAVKMDAGNITASRYPILQNWVILQGQRLTASLIDIPNDISPKDLLVINAHFRCCNNNYDRQREADAFVKFIQDAKTPGGVIDLPEGTPFVLSGDLNLVGYSQQLTTLLTGETVNFNQFGPGGPMDWDNSDLKDVISLHTDDRFAFTWKNDFSSYPPSRLDFHIISGSVMEIEKAFTLQTETMTQAHLDQYGLLASDGHAASDHLPKVTDLLLPSPVAVSNVENLFQLSVFPNPTNGIAQLDFSLERTSDVSFFLENANGAVLRQWKDRFRVGINSISFDLTALPKGFYFIKIKTEEGIGVVKLAKE